MLDFLILYEHKARELESVCLLKFELEKRGYSVNLLNLYDLKRFMYIFYLKPKVIITPALYDNIDLYYHVYTIVGNIDKVVNLQWEQVLSEYWEELKFHNPRENAIYAVHICWGEAAQRRLLSAGVENAIITGPIHMDFLRNEYKHYYLDKEELASKFKFNSNRKTLLYISSFTLANMDEKEITKISKRVGSSIDRFYEIMRISKTQTLKWIEQLLIDREDIVFIYRPHPNEITDIELFKLEQKYSNFKVIGDYSVRQWIVACDKIFTWISTSIVDAYFANKYCNVLQPIKVDSKFEPVIYKGAHCISTYNDFINTIDSNNNCFPITPELIRYHYNFDTKIPSYIRICDFLEYVYNCNKFDISRNVKPSKIRIKDVIKPLVKRVILKFNINETKAFFLSNTQKNKLKQFFKANKKQSEDIATTDEINEIMSKIKAVFNNTL